MPDSVITTSMRGRPSSVERNQRRRRPAGRSCRSAAARRSAPAPARSGRLRSSGCRCPTAPARSISGNGMAVGRVALRAAARPGARRPATAKALGMRNGSKPCRLRPVGRIAGVRSRSPPGAGRTKRPSSACSNAGDLVVVGQQRDRSRPVRCSMAQRAVVAGIAGERQRRFRRGAGDQRLDRPRARAARRARPRRPPAAGRRARSRVGASPTTCRPCGISVYSSSSTACVSARDLAPRRRRPRPARRRRGRAAAACAWISSASSPRSAAHPGASARQRSSDAFRSSRPRYSPACATGGVR